MSTATILINDARERMNRSIQQIAREEDLHRAFAGWLTQQMPFEFELTTIGSAAASKLEAERSFKDVSVLGFCVSSGIADSNLEAGLKSGLQWVSGRTAQIGGNPAGFCGNGIALLGIALGARAISDATILCTVSQWMAGFIGSGAQGRTIPPWHLCLFAGAAHILGISLPAVAWNDAAFADVRVALRGFGVLPVISSTDNEAEENQAFQSICACAPVVADGLRAAVQFNALECLLQSVPTLDVGRPSLAGVVGLLHRVEAALRRWTWESSARTRGGTARQWNIDNEYHVQNLLWAMLSPIFPDLEDESYAEAFGQLHPRIDLGIPSLKLIIEVKFVRAGKEFAKIIEEISADVGVYLTRPELYAHVIAFIWDDSGRVNEYDYLCAGLKKLPGIFDAVVVSRPTTFQ